MAETASQLGGGRNDGLEVSTVMDRSTKLSPAPSLIDAAAHYEASDGST